MLKYGTAHPAVTAAVPGTGDAEHMLDNLGGEGRPPTADHLRRMVALVDALPQAGRNLEGREFSRHAEPGMQNDPVFEEYRVAPCCPSGGSGANRLPLPDEGQFPAAGSSRTIRVMPPPGGSSSTT